MIMRVLLSAIFIVGAATHAHAQETTIRENRIIVYGLGTIETPADRARLKFTVKGFGSTLQTAVDVARKKVADLSKELLASGLSEAGLYTSAFMSGDNFEGKAFLSSSRDYRAQIDVVVTVDTLSILEDVVSTLTKGALEQLSDISFLLRRDSALKLEVRKMAVENARTKAELMARQLGIGVGRVVSVDELLPAGDGDFYVPDPNRPLAYSAGSVRAGGTSFYAQRYTIKGGVRVIFEIVEAADAGGKK